MTENDMTEYRQEVMIERINTLKSLGIEAGVYPYKNNTYQIGIDGWNITTFTDLEDVNKCLTAMIETAHFMHQCQESYPNRIKNWTPLEYSE